MSCFLRPPYRLRALLVLAPLVLAACATPGGPFAPTATSATAPAAAPGPARSASSPRPPGAPVAAPAPGQLQPFAAVIREARRIDGGLFTLWQKEDKVWLEVKPEDFDQPLFLSPKIVSGIGESLVLGGAMVGRGRIVELHRVANQVELVARNPAYVALPNTPEARAVASGFASSLLAASSVASQAHPQSKAVLVEANGLFLNDMLGLGMLLQRNFRQGYVLDGRHTGFTAVRAKPDQVIFEVRAHYATGTLAVPQPGAPATAPKPTVPQSLPDARSMLVGLHYALARLPAQPMAPRRADPRLGHFKTAVSDFSSDIAVSPRQRYVNRWRLEKKDPAAAMSEPVKPITFWLDRSIPLRYRDALASGALAWNAAFEKIGFRNAIVVRVQPDDADFDSADLDVASIRWITSARAAFDGYGPSHVDPRTGEILDADVLIDSGAARTVRTIRSRVLGGQAGEGWARLMQFGDAGHADAQGLADGGLAPGDACHYAEHAAEQFAYALEVLASRGDVLPDGPEAQAFVLDRLKAVAMHEVGHALGLRHNFRASRAYTLAQLADPAFTAANGIAASVMDYPDLNLPPPNVPFATHGGAFRSALGPYDYWAIEYAYKPIAREAEAAELQRIAARSAEPQLAYGTDEDNSLGIDAESLTYDLGDDPVAFARSRLDIARDLIRRQESRGLRPDEDYSVLRRSLRYAVRDVAGATGVVARQIGGLRTLRDFPGSGRDPMQPVPAAVQRQALELLAGGVLSAEGLRVSPALQRRLAPDYLDREEAMSSGDASQTDFPFGALVLGMQRALLTQLMSDTVATRVLDNEAKVAPGEAFRLSEMYERLTREIWSELGQRADIPGPRRELQREHLNRLTTALLRPTTYTRADARALLRQQAQALLPRLQSAAAQPGLGAEARAHLLDSADSLQQALSARLERQGA